MKKNETGRTYPNQEVKINKTYRVYVTILFGGVLMMTGLYASPFSPFAKTAKRVFNVDLDQINLTASLYSLSSIVTGLPANYWIFKLGMRKSVLLSCGLFFAGNGIKLLATVSVYFVHLGQFVAGLGVPFVTNSLALFAGHWYSEKGNSRGVCISILSLMNPIGVILSFLSPFFFIDPEASTPELEIQVFNYLTSFMLLSAFWFVLAISSFYEKDHDFSERDTIDSAQQRKELDELTRREFLTVDFKTQIKVLWNDPAYVGMLLAAGVGFGCFLALEYSMNFIVSVWTYTEIFGSYCLLVGTIIGTVISISYSVVFLKYSKQLRNYQFMMIFSAGFVLLIITSLYWHKQFFLLWSIALYVAINMCAFPLLIESTAKRVGEHYLALGTGVLYFASQISNGLIFYLLGYVMNNEKRETTLYALVIAIGFSSLAMFFCLFSEFKINNIFGIDSRNTQQMLARLSIQTTPNIQKERKRRRKRDKQWHH